MKIKKKLGWPEPPWGLRMTAAAVVVVNSCWRAVTGNGKSSDSCDTRSVRRFRLNSFNFPVVFAMHPPWITFNFLLLLFATSSAVSEKAEQNEGDNSTVSRPQREIYERERRLIPYMTYYITQNLASPNTGVRQNVYAPPIATPRENVYQLDSVPKIPLNTVHNVNPQQIEILPKPVIRLQSPSFISPTIQAYKPKESEVFPQIYRLESGVIRPRIHPQIQPQQIQSETQPLQVVKVNSVPPEQKYAAPQLIKIIPIITKLPLEDTSAKSYAPQQPQFTYTRPNVHALTQDSGAINDGNYYKEPIHHQNSYQGNKIYSSSIPRENPQVRLIGPTVRPDPNKYTVAKIIISTTTPSPYTEIKYNTDRTVGDANSVPIASAPADYSSEAVISTVPSFTGVTPRPKVYYIPKAEGEQGQEQQQFVQKVEQLPRLRVPQEEKIRFVATVTPVPVANDLESPQWKAEDKSQIDALYNKQALNNVFALLKETNKLPQNLTPDNIDTGIKTLALILERLQEQRNYQKAQASGTSSEAPQVVHKQQTRKKVHSFPEKSGTSTPGRPGIDYPIYSSIPQTNFDCSTQRYKGFFGDPDTKCQVWHYCDLNGGQASFLCPNGTIFSQVALTCDWWFNVKCASTSQLYVLNERLYKYILPFSPSFPEDYSGPVVDTYLAAKFKEMEAKSRSKALKSVKNSTTTVEPDITTEVQTEVPTDSGEEFQTLNTGV